MNEQARRTVELVTPEGVPLELPLATLFERGVALALDLGLILVCTFLLAIVGAIISLPTGLAEPWALVLIGIFLLRYGYFVYFEVRWHGATPAKRLMRLRVVSRDGGGLTVEAVFARNLMRDLELFLPIVALLAPEALVGPSPAWLWMPAIAWVAVLTVLPFVTKERQRAGDLVGGTIVVRVPKRELVRDVAARESQDLLSFTPRQLSFYGEHELETLADLLRRAEEGAATQQDLRIVAAAIARKIGYRGPEPEQHSHYFLRVFYRSQRGELEKRLLFGKRVASKYDR